MRAFLGGIAASLLLASMIVSGQTVQSVPMLENESSDSWFVELASPPAVEGTALATLDARRSELSRGRRGRRRPVHARTAAIRDLWNGVTVRATAGDGLEAARASGRAVGVPRGPDARSSRPRNRRARSPIS